MKKLDDSLEIVFFTTMPTLHILYNEGYTTYHLSGRKKNQDMTAPQWNAMVEEQLSLVFTNHLPKAYVTSFAYVSSNTTDWLDQVAPLSVENAIFLAASVSSPTATHTLPL